MFRISVDALLGAAEELKLQDDQLKRNMERLEEISGSYGRPELGLQGGFIAKLAEKLEDGRKNLYEIWFALQRIREIYQRQEERLLDMLEENEIKPPRDSSFLAISFTEETMELIRKIKL